MAEETFSGSFDSTSLPLRGREVPLRMTGIKFIELTCCGNQTDPPTKNSVGYINPGIALAEALPEK
jgi:hypothetical protein